MSTSEFSRSNLSDMRFLEAQTVSTAKSEAIDLTNCDREPIHIPGSIQPHGVLLVLQEPALTIIQISSNSIDVLGLPPSSLLEQPLAKFIEADQLNHLHECLGTATLDNVNPLSITWQSGGQPKTFDGVLHRTDRVLVLELEPIDDETAALLPTFYHIMRSSAAVLQGASNLQDLSQHTAELVRQLTGFDRVMIYRFHEDWHGEVIAEARREDVEPYLGLHYPASDIPSQARELYRHNWLRLIADTSYKPAPLVPQENPITGRPLNLSSSVLRSVSPIHIQYLKNMGVGASMSVSLIVDKQLWGLISCHHDTDRKVPYTIRAACEFLGQMLSLQIAARENVESYAYRTHVKDVLSRLMDSLLQKENVQAGLLQDQQALLEVVNAQGAVLCFAGECIRIGEAPTEAECQKIVDWLKQQHNNEVFFTNSFYKNWHDAVQLKDHASGLLAISISPLQGSYILWCRPEVIRVVQWGGDPNKPVEIENGVATLHPRTSFAAWSETVRLQALPWQSCEIEAARSLRSSIIDRVLQGLVLSRAQELAELNKKLEQSNTELDAFAYIVSHDLKEPLRGIHNYVSILQEDYNQKLDEEGLRRLTILARLSERLDDLITSLLHYSRVSRIDFAFAETNLNEELERVLDILKTRLDDQQVEIRLPRPLPVIWCDHVRIGEVFNNLITNALKYNDKSQKWIEIGYIAPDEPYSHYYSDQSNGVANKWPDKEKHPLIIYVRDNGIGIREKYFESIFRIFKRLHGRDKFGGGTGAGLTIVKRIIERHHGQMWLESDYGVGTTFYFTLQEG